jgi:hypothetical protein
MEINALAFIQQTSTLHNYVVENKIISVIVEELNKIPDIKNLKMSLDLLLHIALMIENMTADNKLVNKPKGYKLDMLLKVFEKLGLLNREEDKQFIINGINFLHSAGKIKRLGLFKRLFAKIYNFLLKRI